MRSQNDLLAYKHPGLNALPAHAHNLRRSGADSVRIASARAQSTRKRCRQRTHCQRTRTTHKKSSRGETESAHCQRMQAARTVLPANALPANAHSSARRTATIRIKRTLPAQRASCACPQNNRHCQHSEQHVHVSTQVT